LLTESCGQLPTFDAPIRRNNVIGALQHVWVGGCGRTSRPRSIMQLRLSTFWSLNSLNPTSNIAAIDCTISIQHTTVYECSPHFLSTPLRIQLQLVVCNVCQTQTPFSQTTTAALSVGRPRTYICAINISVALSQLSHCYLYSGMRKKNVGYYFLSNPRSCVFTCVLLVSALCQAIFRHVSTKISQRKA
jgi:hypothetical protein